MRIQVVGIGTDRGDDAAGLRVAERLAGRLPPGVGVVACRRPGPDLATALDGVDAAVLVVAVRSGAPPGRVQRIAPEQLPEARAWSSHGLGLVEGLALARALGRAPARLAIVGIEGRRADGDARSREVERGVDRACACVLGIVGELRGEHVAPGGG
ncbi:MAG: hydrogenase maturation protease [Myxococcota bacterium]